MSYDYFILLVLSIGLSRISYVASIIIPLRMIYQDKMAINDYLGEAKYKDDFHILSSIRDTLGDIKPFALKHVTWDIAFVIVNLVVFYELNDTEKTWWMLGASSILLILSRIDFQTMLLPDILIVCLLGVGVMANNTGVFVPQNDAVYTATVVFFGVYAFIKAYELIFRKEVMGRGDIKLIAVSFLFMPATFFGSFIVVACIGFLLQIVLYKAFLNGKEEAQPFGPMLCLSTFLHVMYGDILQYIL